MVDVVLKYKGNPNISGIRIVGKESIKKWKEEAEEILSKIQKISKNHDLSYFFGLRFGNDFRDIEFELIRSIDACEQALD